MWHATLFLVILRGEQTIHWAVLVLCVRAQARPPYNLAAVYLCGFVHAALCELQTAVGACVCHLLRSLFPSCVNFTPTVRVVLA